MKELFENMSTATVLAIVAIIVATISALFAWRSNIIAVKSLKLSEKQYDENQPDFDVYYNRGVRYLTKDKDKKNVKRLLLFNLTIRNTSTFKNTFKAELKIEVLRSDDTLSSIVIDHNPLLNDLLNNQEMTFYPIDIELSEKGTATMWTIFEQPEILLGDYRIEKFVIVITDLANNKKTQEAVLINNVEL